MDKVILLVLLVRLLAADIQIALRGTMLELLREKEIVLMVVILLLAVEVTTNPVELVQQLVVAIPTLLLEVRQL